MQIAECTEMCHFGIKIQKCFSGGGTAPSPEPSPLWRRTPLPKPHLPRRLRRIDLAPPFTNPGSALAQQSRFLTPHCLFYTPLVWGKLLALGKIPGCGGCAPSGVQGKSPWSGGMGRSPQKLKAFCFTSS